MVIMEIVSLFSGCGGTDLGLEKAGHQVVWANDFDKTACETYGQNFSTNPVCQDISKIADFPKAEMLVGCYPCQGFSFYGKREKSDPRNYLFQQFARALGKIRPKYFIAENVKGLMFGYGQEFLSEMVSTFSKKNYQPYVRLVNVKDYGLAQDRERVFIIGVRKDLGKKYEFPEKTRGPEANKPYRTLRDEIGDFSKPDKADVCDYSFSSHYMSRNRKRGWNEVSFTIQASGRHAPLHPSGSPMKFVRKDVFEFGEGPNRRLSYKECAAIQSFPKSFKFSGRLEEKYKQIGNAVPPAMSKILVESLESL